MTKYVYSFTEGNRDMKDLLGGKGANLAEMTTLGLPVPPGFTITTEACRAYLAAGEAPETLDVEVTAHLREVEQAMGRRLGDPSDPLLVSVRSGAKFSMPGMMETVLNIGLNDESVEGLAAQSGNDRFAWDSYRRLIQMFGKTVQDIDGDRFADILHKLQADKGYKGDLDMTTADLKHLVEEFKKVVEEETGEAFPQDPRRQMDLAIEAVFRSWNTERARLYRRRERIPNDLGTAVNVCTMVFGNMGETSGTGVCFTRDPSTGHSGVYGDYLVNAQGEDVVAGIRNTLSLADLERLDKKSYDELRSVMVKLETHYRDLCDIEFTIQQGKLWMLQTRVGKRTAAAAFRVATQLVDERLITTDEAVTRVTGDQLTALLFPQFDKAAEKTVVTKGMPASPGAAVGEIVLDNDQAASRVAAGASVILVRRETNPDDLAGMMAASGVLTARGGKTSHAAVVARGMGRCCVVGAEDLVVDEAAGTIHVRSEDLVLKAGDVIAIDGTTGEVFKGDVPVVDSPVMTYISKGLEAALDASPDADTQDLVRSVDRILTRADKRRRLEVRANADNPEDAERARSFGAQGIGLCRTEHMFFGEHRLPAMHEMILATNDEERRSALDKILPMQQADFEAIFAEMKGLPVTVRLLDPPLHEFMPDLVTQALTVQELELTGADPGELAAERTTLAQVKKLHEQNPMLGTRGCRLGMLYPQIPDMQARAVVRAALAVLEREGETVQLQIMIPLVHLQQELKTQREIVVAAVDDELAKAGKQLDYKVGTMIELPRAALCADQIAQHADFFSFGTNDLTQTTLGISRDDAENGFLGWYESSGVVKRDPFATVDVDGVGQLVRMGVEKGRSVNPSLSTGVCGEHGGDPDSIAFFQTIGLDYVSCSPYRVPIARFAAAKAKLAQQDSAS